MNQRHDLLAISLLLFSAVFAVWLTAGPMNFALKDWQPLIASFVALGAAALAYKAAMAKVGFDRELASRTDKRKLLGLCLRLEFGMRVLKHEADFLESGVPKRYVHPPHSVNMNEMVLPKPEALDDAWQNLDSFPRFMSRNLSAVRDALYDFDKFKGAVGGAVFAIDPAPDIPKEVRRLIGLLRDISKSSGQVLSDVAALIAALNR